MIKDPLIQLGKVIALAREKSSLTLNQLAQQAKVSVQHVESIECANRKALPEETYLYGYLKKILKTLKFNNYDKVLDDYKEAEASFVLQQMLMETDVQELNRAEDKISINSYFSWKHIAVIFLILLIVIGAIVIRFKVTTMGLKLSPTVKNELQPVLLPNHVESTLLLDNVQEAATTVATLPAPKTNPRVLYGGSGKLPLRLIVTQNAWLQIVAIKQDRVLYEGNISPAQIAALELSDDEGFVVSSDNAAAFMVDSGKKTYTLGSSKQVIEWYYPKSARAIYRHRQRENLRKSPDEALAEERFRLPLAKNPGEVL